MSDDYYSFPNTPGMDDPSKPRRAASEGSGDDGGTLLGRDGKSPSRGPQDAQSKAAEAYGFNMGSGKPEDLTPEQAEHKITMDNLTKDERASIGRKLQFGGRTVELTPYADAGQDPTIPSLGMTADGKTSGRADLVSESGNRLIYRLEDESSGSYTFASIPRNGDGEARYYRSLQDVNRNLMED